MAKGAAPGACAQGGDMTGLRFGLAKVVVVGIGVPTLFLIAVTAAVVLSLLGDDR